MEWAAAAAGELGEAINILKKIRRGDFEGSALDRAEHKAAMELADCLIYLDLVFQRINRQMSSYVKAAFNNKSKEIGYEGTI
jgi:hypothetical protein